VRRPWPALVLLSGGALLLVALYLPWQRVSFDFHEFGDIFTPEPFEGWASTVAPATALAALLLVALSAVAFVRPELSTRLPIGRCALAAAYFGVAVAAETRDLGKNLAPEIGFAYGAYLGLGAVAALLVGGLALRQAELRQLRSLSYVASAILVSALLLVFLLPWATFSGFEYRGILAPPAQVAAVVAICMPRAPRSLALVCGLFTAAAFSAWSPAGFDREYGAWLGIGLAIAFAIVSLSGGIRRPKLEPIPWPKLTLSAAGLMLVASFFLPGEAVCSGDESGTVCVFPRAWSSDAASGAAILAIVLIVGEFRRREWLPPRAELAAGIALLVTTLGFQFGHGEMNDLWYGFWIGAACTAVIVVLAAIGLSAPPLDARLAPIALCVAYLADVVPPWWGEFSFDWPRFFWFAPFSWITLTGALLALTLIRLWLERGPDLRPLFLLPVVIAVLATLDLARAETMTLGGGIVLALCALLVLFAWVERARLLGQGQLRVPEILRIDRL